MFQIYRKWKNLNIYLPSSYNVNIYCRTPYMYLHCAERTETESKYQNLFKFYLSIYLSICLSIYISIYISIYLRRLSEIAKSRVLSQQQKSQVFQFLILQPLLTLTWVKCMHLYIRAGHQFTFWIFYIHGFLESMKSKYEEKNYFGPAVFGG